MVRIRSRAPPSAQPSTTADPGYRNARGTRDAYRNAHRSAYQGAHQTDTDQSSARDDGAHPGGGCTNSAYHSGAHHEEQTQPSPPPPPPPLTEAQLKAIQRVRALLLKTVRNGCTEGEAVAAAVKVRELIEQYEPSPRVFKQRARP
jgi:hypothetical protein